MTASTDRTAKKIDSLSELIPLDFDEKFRLPGTGILFTFKGESIDAWVNSVLLNPLMIHDQETAAFDQAFKEKNK